MVDIADNRNRKQKTTLQTCERLRKQRAHREHENVTQRLCTYNLLLATTIHHPKMTHSKKDIQKYKKRKPMQG